MSIKRLNVGIIGNGKSTNRYNAPFILRRKDKFNLKTIYRRTPENDYWAKIDGVNYTDNLEDLLNDSELDLIVVCTSHNHFELAKQVLEHNHNCLVEKPFTDTYEQAKELFDLATSKNLIVSAYQNRRYDSDFLTTQKVIESGKLGELIELEMHFDYYRPELVEVINSGDFNHMSSFLYGHGCHTLDQVISYFGKPDKVHYDVRQLAGKFSDYFDLDLYYGLLKVSVKSSYHRVKERPSFVVYGKKGMFIKETKDRQEEHLKMFHMPDHSDFGVDEIKHYGTLTYYDECGKYHEEKVETVTGDYASVYDGIYDTIVHNKKQPIHPNETLLLMQILEEGIKDLN